MCRCILLAVVAMLSSAASLTLLPCSGVTFFLAVHKVQRRKSALLSDKIAMGLLASDNTAPTKRLITEHRRIFYAYT